MQNSMVNSFIVYANYEAQITGISGVTIKKRVSEIFFISGESVRIPSKFITSTRNASCIFDALNRYQLSTK